MKSNRKWLVTSILTVSLAGLPALAQDPSAPPSSGGWKRFQQNAPGDGPAQFDPSQAPPQRNAPQMPQNPMPQNPGHVTIPAGTWITVRVNEPLSSDHNQAGDIFAATFAQPLIMNGVVVAHRGQMLTGRVSEAKKAGRVSGLSRLGLEVTEIGVADGSQVHVKTSLLQRQGDTSYGRDAFAIGATTATGAAIGAGVNGGVGAGVGAAAGLVASTVGVLLTRGHPTVVYPEMPLTFRLEAPVNIDTTNVAFQPPSPQDYGQQGLARRPGPGYGQSGPGYGQYGPPAPYGPPAYGYYAAPVYGYPYPYYWGPGFGIGFGYRYGYGRRW
jgi:hypothetical protein